MGTPRTRRDVEDIIWKQPVPDGADPIWHVMTWDIPSGVVPVARVRELLDEAGLTEEKVATPAIRERGALLRALKEMAENRDTKKVYDDADETSWALLRILSGDKVTKLAGMRQEVTVTYVKHPDKGAPNILYSSPDAKEQIEPLLARYLVSYTTRDITSFVMGYCVRKAGGISMRGQGGMYVVPPTGGETVQALAAFVQALAQEPGMAGSHLTDIQSIDSGQTRENMRWHGHRALLADLRNMQTKLRDMLRAERTDEEGKTKIKPDTAAAYLAACDELGQRAALWRDAAEMSVDDITAALDEFRQTFTEVRAGMLLGEFKPALARVARAVDAARRAQVAAAEDDPFALDDDLDDDEDGASGVGEEASEND